MKASPASGPEEFLAILRSLPGDWNGAKADAFGQLVAAFPDPDGPPEWGLRQILRGQLDRRIPPEWRPAFIEVYHQWLGFRAEARAAREDWPGTVSWWFRSLVPGLRRHGWAGAIVSPCGLLVAAVVLAWSCLGAASHERSQARAEADRALMDYQAAVDRRVLATEGRLATLMDASTDDALLEVLASGAQQREALALLLRERERARLRVDAARERAGAWWTWPFLSGR